MRLILFCLLCFIIPYTALPQSGAYDSWQKVKEKGEGTIVVYWYTSKPFIFAESAEEMSGIEYEILEGFKKYLKRHHDIHLNIKWKEAESFNNTYEVVRDSKETGLLGVSAFSITDEREKVIGFAPPYMSDISVLISHKSIPIVKTNTEFEEVFSNLKAITIKGTTYEKDLLAIKQDRKLDFDIRYIPSSQNILRTIEATDGTFGFIDLPIYLMAFNQNTTVGVKRQNLFPVKRKGYAVIYPKNSDWSAPLDEYFKSSEFKEEIEDITDRYLDKDLYHFIENLYLNADNSTILLTKEKELQTIDLEDKKQQIAREAVLRNILIVCIVVILASLLLIYRLYQRRHKTTIILREQKEKIETQSLDIELQRKQLEKRNMLLTQFNEEKNNLIKILAHDLRTPINHISGLVQVYKLENKDLTEGQLFIIDQVQDASVRLNGMITKILDIDAIENNRVNIIIEDVHISQFLKHVVFSFKAQADKKNIGLNLILPEKSDDITVKADKMYLTEIFENLISNAIKFSGKGTSIKVILKPDNGSVQIDIVDEGPGLTKDDHKNLFKKYHRLTAQPTGGEQSTGLGLSIVKKYVELMEGEVWCESEYGKGATFCVVLNQ